MASNATGYASSSLPDRLRNDPAETVRRSVATNLNDISKDNSEVVIGVLQR
jgi:3-methyladenine DNA glycosylase AlkC